MIIITSLIKIEFLALFTAIKEAIATIRLFQNVRLQLNEDLTI